MTSVLAPLLMELAAYLGDPDFEGTRPTGLPGVRFFRMAKHLPRQPLVYDPGLVIIGQGHKIGHLNGRKFTYGPENYLILGVPMPFECETFAGPEAPLLGLFVDVQASRIQSLIDAMGTEGAPPIPSDNIPCGVEPAPLGAAMAEATARLIRCLRQPDDVRVLGASMVDELVYRALQGPHGQALVALTRQQTAFARVARALSFVHQNYAGPIAVEDLAQVAAMSESTFFRAFKTVTGDTPLQYIKKIRLDKALDLLRKEDRPVNAVAYEVGYESAAQFSREFKRHFSASPTAARSAANIVTDPRAADSLA